MAESRKKKEHKMRQCLLYEIFDGMNVSEAYKHFRGKMGEDAMGYTNFEYYFDQFYRTDNYHFDKDKKNLRKMADSLRNDPEILRLCILYEVRRGKSVEKAYKNVCKALGNNAIEFLDFDFWYYRLYHGNYDMDYDRKRDPKSLLFSDLPADAIGKVVEKLELKEQLKLRKVSHGFRCLIDEQKLAYKTIRVTCKSDSVQVIFNDKHVVYTNTVIANLCAKVINSWKEEDFVKRALNDIAIAIKNPKVKLESLHFNYEYNIGYGHHNKRENAKKNAVRMHDEMRYLLKTFNNKISVNSLSMLARNQEDVLVFISFLKPSHLERIEITFVHESLSPGNYVTPKFVNIDKIITLDQWKMAKHVTINTSVSVPIDNFFHFKSFDVQLDSDSTETLIHLRDALSKLNEIPQCRLRFGTDLDIEHCARISGLKVTPNMKSRYSKIFHYPIPGSNKSLYFGFGSYHVSICPELSS